MEWGPEKHKRNLSGLLQRPYGRFRRPFQGISKNARRNRGREQEEARGDAIVRGPNIAPQGVREGPRRGAGGSWEGRGEVSEPSRFPEPSCGRRGAVLEPSWEPLGCLLGRLGGLLGPSWGHLGPSWWLGGLFDGHLGALLGRLGSLLGHSEALLAASWASLGATWKVWKIIEKP